MSNPHIDRRNYISYTLGDVVIGGKNCLFSLNLSTYGLAFEAGQEHTVTVTETQVGV